MILSENRNRFSGSCADPQAERSPRHAWRQ